MCTGTISVKQAVRRNNGPVMVSQKGGMINLLLICFVTRYQDKSTMQSMLQKQMN